MKPKHIKFDNRTTIVINMRVIPFLFAILLSYCFSYAQSLDSKTYYKIQAAHSQLYLSVGGNSMRNNSSVIQWSTQSKSTEDGQAYKFVSEGDYFKIEVRNKGGKCLTLLKKERGSLVVVSEYKKEDRQLWKLVKEGPFYRIISKINNWSMDIQGVSTNYGAALSVWDQVAEAKNQLFILSPASSENPYWENLGAKINSSISETQPAFSPDGRSMYFSRGNNVNGIISNGNIYMSTMNKKGEWNKPKEVTALNNERHNAVMGFLPSGTSLLLFGDYSGGSALLSITHKTNTGWETPTPIEIKTSKLTQQIWSAAIGSDGKTILLELNTTGRLNESDIYVSFLEDNNTWSSLKSLGKTINIPKKWDGTPYLSPDMKTLYFNSNRNKEKGNQFFMSKRKDDSWTNWTNPIALETSMYPDALLQYYQVPGDGTYAYFVSATKSYGEGDLLRMKIKEEEKPNPFLIINGGSLDKKTNSPIPASIIFEDLETGEQLGILISNPKDGKYQIVLPLGKNYGIYAKSDGYFSLTENLDLRDEQSFNEIQKDLFLSSMESGESIKLNNIFFIQSKPVMLSKSIPELNRLVLLLNENPNLRIRIEGHTDNMGNRDLNIKLSQDRSKAVKDYLVSKGVSKKRLETIGYGPDKPITKSKAPNERKKNRRVEFVIL